MRKNIIQSKTESNKNDIWLSEEGLKKYGKNGWEPLGGGLINDSTPVGDKELFVITPNEQGEFPTILTKDYLNSGMPVICGGGTYLTKSFTKTVLDMGSIYYEDYYIATPAFKSGEKAVAIIANYRPNRPDNPVSFSLATEENIIPIFYNGDGTKFLSDDGTYKEISNPNAIEYFHLGGIPNSGHSVVDKYGESWYEVKLSGFNVQDLYEFLNPVTGVIPSHKYLTITIKNVNLKNRPKLSFPVYLMEEEDKQIYGDTECKILMNRALNTNGTINSYKDSDVCVCYISVFIDSDKTTNDVIFNYRKLNS